MAVTLGDTAITGATTFVNTVTGISIDASGHVRFPNNLYIVLRGITNTGGSGISNAATTISNNGLTYSSDRVTVPVAGVYMITFMSICDSQTARIDSGIRINGSRIVNNLSQDNGSGYQQRSANIHYYLNANDYIQWDNDDWYSPTSSTTTWKTASVALIG